MTEFASIASFYDLMTGYSDRLVNDFGVLKHLVEKFEITSALDAGCGTGVHTIILAKIGIKVLGFDASEEMLEIARANALREGVEPPFACEYFESIPEEWWGRYDAVFCLANSLVGAETPERLLLAIKSFSRALKPGGRVIIQLLNIDYFRRHDRRIIKVSGAENYTFVRFFDFDEQVTRLNVVAVEHNMGKVEHRFISQRILPITADMIKIAAKSNGFAGVDLYADLVLSRSFSADSENLVAVLTR